MFGRCLQAVHAGCVQQLLLPSRDEANRSAEHPDWWWGDDKDEDLPPSDSRTPELQIPRRYWWSYTMEGQDEGGGGSQGGGEGPTLMPEQRAKVRVEKFI
jgi:hypothetical protein